MGIIFIIGLILYFILAAIFFHAFSLEHGVHEPYEYTLKSFYYGLFFPITLIYKNFNGGCLE